MKIDKNKQQKELERYFMAPTLRPFLGLTIKEDTDVEDEFAVKNEDSSKMKTVQQTIHGQVFTTEVIYEEKNEDGTSMREESKITYVLPIGSRLIWEENIGYVANKENFQTLEEIEENYKMLEE